MNIAIPAPSEEAGAELRTAIGDDGDVCVVIPARAELAESLEARGADLVLVDRSLLRHVDLSTMNKLTESGRWPPMLLVDTADGIDPGVASRLRRVIGGADVWEDASAAPRGCNGAALAVLR